MNAHHSDTLTKADFERLSEFRYQLRRFLHVSEAILRTEQITPVQYLMLLHIKGMPGRHWATIAELAERLQTVHHGVVTLVSRCEAAGFVQRRQSTSDRRPSRSPSASSMANSVSRAWPSVTVNSSSIRRGLAIALSGRRLGHAVRHRVRSRQVHTARVALPGLIRKTSAGRRR